MTNAGIFIVNSKGITILGKAHGKDYYDNFGGGQEKTDLSTLHTGIREFIEEFFNIKIPINFLNSLCELIKKNNIIKKEISMFKGTSYIINFNGLNFIFQELCKINDNLKLYNINNNFNIKKYVKERIIKDKPKNGLNEIEYLHFFNINTILKKRIKLRFITDKIINLLLQ